MNDEKAVELEMLCRQCLSGDASIIDRGTRLECANCGAEFVREEALVTVADAEALAVASRVCTCDKNRGCPQCFQRADEMVGSLIRDSYEAEWVVVDVDERDGFPTVVGADYWAWIHDVTVVRAAGCNPELGGGRGE